MPGFGCKVGSLQNDDIMIYYCYLIYIFFLALVSFVLAQGWTAPCIDPYACLEGGWTGWAGEGMALAGS
jgi:hypothetical protein